MTLYYKGWFAIFVCLEDLCLMEDCLSYSKEILYIKLALNENNWSLKILKLSNWIITANPLEFDANCANRNLTNS